MAEGLTPEQRLTPITVDTGKWSDIWPGCSVIWLHEPRGGYGFTVRVPGIVRKVTRAQVQIEVARKDGRKVLRYVTPDRLRQVVR